jgi:hypothetical protein
MGPESWRRLARWEPSRCFASHFQADFECHPATHFEFKTTCCDKHVCFIVISSRSLCIVRWSPSEIAFQQEWATEWPQLDPLNWTPNSNA